MSKTHLDDCYDFRDALVRELTKDLIGPGAEDETIHDAPLDQYITAVLYPLPGAAERVTEDGTADADQDDGSDAESGGDQSAASDPPVAMTNVMNPSSMGLTFAVDPARFASKEAKPLQVVITAARYEPSGTYDGEPRRGRIGTGGVTWKRRPVTAAPLVVDVTTSDPGRYRPVFDRDGALVEGLELFSRVRDPDSNGRRSITLALVNKLKRPRGDAQLRDAYAFLQVAIRVEADGAPVFAERPQALTTLDQEHRSNALLYRHARIYAVGHGCSAGWTHADEGGVVVVWTTFVPEHELLLADSNDKIDARSLVMQWLATTDRNVVLPDLYAFCDAYAAWIDSRRDELATLEDDHASTGRIHIGRCAEAVERMRSGVDLLGQDDVAWNAFVLANGAMLEQRARSVWLADPTASAGPDPSDRHRWRPFQLGFILLCLRGLARPDHPDRKITDLLWFPTGGGKTEAYLGLIAFTTFMRRLSPQPTGSGGGGVTALMRYTLRLVTSQQFQRAAILICACEVIRRRNPTDLGETPISIGLWVGEGATPNAHHGNQERPGTRESLATLRRGQELTTRNPIQLHACPWCGTALDVTNYWLKTYPQLHLVVQCKTDGCEFHNGLPVWVVDEDIYRERPTLLIATLDKFAALPWRTEVASLFNRETADPPPELIIQDELHLISGPLGTVAGLYETAVSTLAARDGVAPKVIASTATIRRARRQGRGLFAQETQQFPPPGLDGRDSYFAIETSRDMRGSRLYTGVMASGKSQTTLLIRVYALLLQRGLELPASDAVRDVYWTLVGYFNSLRVLAGARLAVIADVTEWIERLASQTGVSPRTTDMRIELTSREPSSKIPQSLKEMTISYPDPGAIDVILATNMISVGVDIDRLGLMVVMGQPQGTSEYIQATSRVGRSSPGLILTLLNAGRSRDRSHYEGFVGYHSSLYRHVESTSVTPFSPRARDRGLHAVIIALTRHLIPQMRDNVTAALIHQHETLVRNTVWPVIAARLQHIDEQDEIEETRREFDRVIDEWKTRADEVAKAGERLVYAQYRNRDKSLLWDAGGDGGTTVRATEPFPTQRSFRDVDTTSHLDLVQ